MANKILRAITFSKNTHTKALILVHLVSDIFHPILNISPKKGQQSLFKQAKTNNYQHFTPSLFFENGIIADLILLFFATHAPHFNSQRQPPTRTR